MAIRFMFVAIHDFSSAEENMPLFHHFPKGKQGGAKKQDMRSTSVKQPRIYLDILGG